MKFLRDTHRVVVPAGSTRDVVMAGQERPFNDLTIWAKPAADEPVVGARFATQPVNCTGVAITAVSSNTTDGNGTLSFTFVGTLLDWQAPGAGAPGAAQNVGAGGTFVLDGGDGSTITVMVTAGALPGADQSDTIAITTTFPTPATRSFTTQVFFGPTAQGAAAAHADNNASIVYDPGDAGRIWSANEPSSNPQQAGRANEVRGFPVTVRIVNNDTVALAIAIEFVAMGIDQG